MKVLFANPATGEQVDYLYQWDTGIDFNFEIENGTTVEVVFSTVGMTEGIRKECTESDGKWTCKVPDTVLQYGTNINAYITYLTGENLRVVEYSEIPVRKRVKPANYVSTTDDAFVTVEQMLVLIKQAVTDSKTAAAESAKSKNEAQCLVEGFDARVAAAIIAAQEEIQNTGLAVLGSIPDNFEEVAAKADEAIRTKSDAIVCTESGTSIIVRDSSDDPFRGLRLMGYTEQVKTTGAQLANLPDAKETVTSGIAWSCKDGGVSAKGTATATSSSATSAGVAYVGSLIAGTYTISGSRNGVRVFARVGKSDGAIVYYNEQTFTLDEAETEVRIYCQVENGATVNETVYPMLNAGTEALPWELYTGDAPSPSPDYPQELEDAGEWRNLYDEDTYPLTAGYVFHSDGNIVENSDNYKKTKDYIPFAKYAGKMLWLNKSVGGNNPGMAFYDAEKNYISGVKTQEFTVPEGTEYMRFSVNKDDDEIMIVYASQKSITYRPYTGQNEVAVEVLGKNILVFDEFEIAETNTDRKYKDGIFSYTAKVTIGITTIIAPDVIEKYNKKQTLAPGIYTFSVAYISDKKFKEAYIRIAYDDGTEDSIIENTPKRIEKQAQIVEIKTNYVELLNGTIVSVKMQLEYNSAATEYESPKPIQQLIHTGSLPGIPLGTTIPDAIANSPEHMAGVWLREKDQQYYISDTVDYGAGKYVQRVNERILNGTELWQLYTVAAQPLVNQFFVYVYGKYSLFHISNYKTVYSNYFKPGVVGDRNKTQEIIYSHVEGYAVNTSIAYGSIDEWKAWLAEKYASGNPVTIRYILATPIETDLPASEIAAYKALHTNYPVTTVANDCDVNMDVEHNTDPKNHIEQNYVAKSLYTALEERVAAIESHIANS